MVVANDAAGLKIHVEALREEDPLSRHDVWDLGCTGSPRLNDEFCQLGYPLRLCRGHSFANVVY